MSRDHHIIHRVTLDIEAPDIQSARDVQDEAVRLLYNDILPRLESWLDSLSLGDRHIRFDRMDLHLGRIGQEQFHGQLGDAILHALTEQLEQSVLPGPEEGAESDRDHGRLSQEENLVDTVLYFLQTGRLPWWSPRTISNLLSEKKLARLVMTDTYSVEKLRILLQRDGQAIERMIMQYSGAFILKLIAAIASGRSFLNEAEMGTVMRNIMKRFGKDDTFKGMPVKALKKEYLKRVLHQVVRNEAFLPPDHLNLPYVEMKADARSYAVQSLNFDHRPSTIDHRQSTRSTQTTSAASEDGLFVSNAGLVLLHPFLEYFFKDFDLLEEGRFRDERTAMLAVHLLHFLAEKEEAPAEYDLIFEKFLCGLSPEQPVERFIRLSRRMKEEADQMLKAVIGHWNALKNTSPDGLREGFLHREGKLMLNEFQNRLVVDSKSHDVLLSFLPWGYGIIKLPWLQQPLFVDWNS